MTRNRLIITAVIVILLAIGGNAYLGLKNLSQVQDTQHTLGVSEKQSTETRVSTVEQRCHLTVLDLQMARRTDPAAVGAYQKSLDKCLTQLKSVKAINAATPTVR